MPRDAELLPDAETRVPALTLGPAERPVADTAAVVGIAGIAGRLPACAARPGQRRPHRACKLRPAIRLTLARCTSPPCR